MLDEILASFLRALHSANVTCRARSHLMLIDVRASCLLFDASLVHTFQAAIN